MTHSEGAVRDNAPYETTLPEALVLLSPEARMLLEDLCELQAAGAVNGKTPLGAKTSRRPWPWSAINRALDELADAGLIACTGTVALGDADAKVRTWRLTWLPTPDHSASHDYRTRRRPRARG